MRLHAPKRRLTLLVAVVGGLITASAAQAAITTATNTPVGATAIATAMASNPAHVTGAVFDAHPGDGPNGTADAPINVFPTNGTTFGILTTGNVQFADDPNSSPSTGQNDGGPNVRGNTDFDVTILRVAVNAPPGSNCLTFDFKFLSDEFPEFVGSAFNDAFIAELDTSTWTTSGSTITAPNNFAFDSGGGVVSVNNATFNAGNASGTTYDGATTLLSASTQITTPGAHNLFLSIFDQQDRIYDSAAFLDNLRIGFVPNPAVNCAPGAQPVNFSMTLTPATDENPVGTPHTVTATLEDSNGNPVAGAPIEFTVSGANTASGTGTTNASGQATFTYTGTNLGLDSIAACYNADGVGACEATASAEKTWVVGPPASLTLTPAADTNPVGTQHCVTATVRDIAGNPTPGITVRFGVSGSVTTSGSAVTDANGQATFCYIGPALPGADAITAYADTDNDSVRDADEPAATAAKTWVLPASTEGCKVTYGGRITAANGDKATFGGNAQAPDKGQEQYQDHGPAQPMNVKAINVQAVVCNAAGTAASIFGQATINGSGTFNYRIDLQDLGEPGTTDTYRIRLSNGYDSGVQVLNQGNVQIHL